MYSQFMKHGQKNIKLSNLMKILPVEAKLLHEDGRTDGQTGQRQ